MATPDIKIVVGADVTTSVSDIRSSLESKFKSRPLKVNAKLGSESEFRKSFKNIKVELNQVSLSDKALNNIAKQIQDALNKAGIDSNVGNSNINNRRNSGGGNQKDTSMEMSRANVRYNNTLSEFNQYKKSINSIIPNQANTSELKEAKKLLTDIEVLFNNISLNKSGMSVDELNSSLDIAQTKLSNAVSKMKDMDTISDGITIADDFTTLQKNINSVGNKIGKIKINATIDEEPLLNNLSNFYSDIEIQMKKLNDNKGTMSISDFKAEMNYLKDMSNVANDVAERIISIRKDSSEIVSMPEIKKSLEFKDIKSVTTDLKKSIKSISKQANDAEGVLVEDLQSKFKSLRADIEYFDKNKSGYSQDKYNSELDKLIIKTNELSVAEKQLFNSQSKRLQIEAESAKLMAETQKAAEKKAKATISVNEAESAAKRDLSLKSVKDEANSVSQIISEMYKKINSDSRISSDSKGALTGRLDTIKGVQSETEILLNSLDKLYSSAKKTGDFSDYNNQLALVRQNIEALSIALNELAISYNNETDSRDSEYSISKEISKRETELNLIKKQSQEISQNLSGLYSRIELSDVIPSDMKSGLLSTVDSFKQMRSESDITVNSLNKLYATANKSGDFSKFNNQIKLVGEQNKVTSNQIDVFTNKVEQLIEAYSKFEEAQLLKSNIDASIKNASQYVSSDNDNGELSSFKSAAKKIKVEISSLQDELRNAINTGDYSKFNQVVENLKISMSKTADEAQKFSNIMQNREEIQTVAELTAEYKQLNNEKSKLDSDINKLSKISLKESDSRIFNEEILNQQSILSKYAEELRLTWKDALNSGDFAEYFKVYQKMSAYIDNIRQSVDKLSDSYKKQSDDIKASNQAQDEYISKEKQFESNVNNVDSLYQKLTKGIGWTAAKYSDSTKQYYESIETNYNKIKSLFNKYNNLSKNGGADFISQTDLDGDTDSISKIASEFKNAEVAIDGAGKKNKTFMSSLTGLAQKFTKWFGVSQVVMRLVQYAKDAVNAVIEIDTAMTELKKVTNETDATYSNFLSNASSRAKELGTTIVDIVNATADFARLGYGIEDASQLADAATIYKNVGDGIEDITEASNSIISTMQAFGIQATDSMSIVDKFNEVGKIVA